MYEKSGRESVGQAGTEVWLDKLGLGYLLNESGLRSHVALHFRHLRRFNSGQCCGGSHSYRKAYIHCLKHRLCMYCMYPCNYAFIYLCMYCMYVCMYVQYVCMYAFIYLCTVYMYMCVNDSYKTLKFTYVCVGIYVFVFVCVCV